METKFDVQFLEDAVRFMDSLDQKTREKVYFNIRKAQITNDPELFKKLTATIWEFRTLYNRACYRLFAFWDKSGNKKTIVVATHGLVKKTGKTRRQTWKKQRLLEKDTSTKQNNHMPAKKIKSVSLDTMMDKHIGKIGTPSRDTFEQELRIELLGHAIREARLYHNLTQDQLGKLVGVQKAQISKLENNFTNARFDTVIKVFNALHAKVNFKVELPKRKLAAP